MINSKISGKDLTVKMKEFEDYKELINRVSLKIDVWYKAMTEKKHGRFVRDDEFIDLQPSPTKFRSDCSSSSEEYSMSKDSTNFVSPKEKGHERFKIPNLNISRRKVRVTNKRSKNNLKFKIKRNSTYFHCSKPHSPDIKKRKSFKNFLKGSSKAENSFRLKKKDIED